MGRIEILKENNMRRILQVNINNEGGAFSLVYQVQKMIDQKEYVFDYYTMGKFNYNSVYLDIIKNNSHIYEADLRKNRFIGHLLLPIRFYKFLKNERYEIIHIHSDSSWKAILYAFPAKIVGIKNIIIHSHSTGINGEQQFFKKMCHRIAKQLISCFCTKFVACSSEAAKWMFDTQKVDVTIVKNGVNLCRFKPDMVAREQERRKLNYFPENIVIGTVGDFSDTKNPMLLIEIFEQLLKDNDCFRLLFVGSGSNEKNIKEIVKKKGLESKVLFMGRTDHVEIALEAMDAFVLPSKFEGLPVSAVEAQATGLPTFLSPNIKKEVAISGMAWFPHTYLDVNEWKNLIIQNLYNVKFQNITERVKNAGFDINDTVKKFTELYMR